PPPGGSPPGARALLRRALPPPGVARGWGGSRAAAAALRRPELVAVHPDGRGAGRRRPRRVRPRLRHHRPLGASLHGVAAPGGRALHHALPGRRPDLERARDAARGGARALLPGPPGRVRAHAPALVAVARRGGVAVARLGAPPGPPPLGLTSDRP